MILSDILANGRTQTTDFGSYLKNMVDVKRGVHEQVIYKSQTEATFAKELASNESVTVFAKLPGWFKVPTPLGPSNPDWAVLTDRDRTERLYFFVGTKYSLYDADLRDKEGAKIDCGPAHFEALAVGKKAVKVSDLFA